MYLSLRPPGQRQDVRSREIYPEPPPPHPPSQCEELSREERGGQSEGEETGKQGRRHRRHSAEGPPERPRVYGFAMTIS